MWPRIGPIPTYSIFYLLGFVFHFVIGWRIAPTLNLKRRWGIVVSLCYVLGMIPGAKFLYHWRHVDLDPLAAFRVQTYMQGGLWGGLLAYVFLVGAVALLLTRQRREVLDLAALTIPIPWAVSKLGCLLNGCCNGSPCSLPWAITFPEGCASSYTGIPVHPSQIYEMMLMATLYVLYRMLRNETWRGTLLFWFVGVYGMGRAVTDVCRGDEARYIQIGPVTVTQLICLLSALVAFVLVWVLHSNSAEKNLGMDSNER